MKTDNRRLWAALIIAGGAAGLGWAVLEGGYARHVLEQRRVEVVVFCDTAPLRGRELKVFALYDSVALSPLARWLGLYQNRQPQEVKTYFFYRLHDFELTRYSVKIKSVPWGPLARIMFFAGKDRFYVDISDRRLKDGVLYARAE